MARRLTEEAWLNHAHDVSSGPDRLCICKPSANGHCRWPGYLGSRYVESRVLLLGSIHNASRLFTPALHKFEDVLSAWCSHARSIAGDREFLAEMRVAHIQTIPVWAKAGVWQIFDRIRQSIGLDWEDVAFSNLARCHTPRGGNDDVCVSLCQQSYPIADLVAAIEPKIVFIAKGGAIGRGIVIPGESIQKPLVVRYSNHSTGTRYGRHYSVWIPDEAPAWKLMLAGGATEVT